MSDLAPALPGGDGRRARERRWGVGLALAAMGWVGAYASLETFAAAVLFVLPVDAQSRTGLAVAFFAADAPKVLLLLALVVFAMGVVRSFFSAERTRALLAGRREGAGTLAAAALGTVTPFCSCSAVPLFIGFVSAGVPLGVTFAFLVAAPMVNEVALGLLFALLGWRVALTYLALGLAVAIVAGWVIGRLHLEAWLAPWVRALRAEGGPAESRRLGWLERAEAGWAAVREIFGRVWRWVLVGIGVGALIHGYLPTDALGGLMGPGAWWSVPLVVLIGIPLYSNAAGMAPVVIALLGKGAALGTVLAFMMSVTALSFPEMILLHQVMRTRLIAVFVAVVGCGILAVGFLFNAIF